MSRGNPLALNSNLEDRVREELLTHYEERRRALYAKCPCHEKICGFKFVRLPKALFGSGGEITRLWYTTNARLLLGKGENGGGGSQTGADPPGFPRTPPG